LLKHALELGNVAPDWGDDGCVSVTGGMSACAAIG